MISLATDDILAVIYFVGDERDYEPLMDIIFIGWKIYRQ